MAALYKRAVLKLSGEALGLDGKLFDFPQIDRAAAVLREAAKETQLGVVIGAGNIWRGRQGVGMDAVTADYMGMLGTVVNCLAMRDAIWRAGGKARVLSAIEMPRVCEAYTALRASEALESGEIVLLAGGSGNPFFSTDTAVALRAVELRADALLLAKAIDGVYTADPEKDKSATFIPEITYHEALARQLRVMDAAAFALCADNSVPVTRVFALKDPENILRVLRGEPLGTVLHP